MGELELGGFEVLEEFWLWGVLLLVKDGTNSK